MIVMKIADISLYQGKIDWAQAREELGYVIFRASYGMKADSTYKEHTQNCGLPYGVYHYCKARTTEEARQEAEYFVKCANVATPNLYFADIEHKTQTAENVDAVCVAFLTRLKELGCKRVGLYIGQGLYPHAKQAIGMCDAVWIPRYGKDTGEVPEEKYHPIYPCDLWQYTSKGAVKGVNHTVDLNILWGDKTLNWFRGEPDKAEQKEEGTMANRIQIRTFVEDLYAAYKRKDGYIMGATGQDPKKWAVNSWWFNQYTNAAQKQKALYWREHAERVWDCNGLAEGIYYNHTGVSINTYARMNYATWCDPKGSGMIPVKYRVPGAAIFWGSTAGNIHHVAYLYKPVVSGKPDGDWYIIEARGVMYGVVMTRLYERKPNFWGWMTKYFNYEEAGESSGTNKKRMLRNGTEGSDVKVLQSMLIELGYDCGRWGADGDFGDGTELAVKQFQKEHGLEVDGIVGEKTWAALDKAMAEAAKPVEDPQYVIISGGNCYVRDLPNTSGKALGIARNGEKLEYAGATDDETKWLKVKFNDKEGWVSGKYGKLVK